ncbi:hypothetical protein ACHAW5_007348 [Stephanodiscus triporus]|uniref:DUF1736 domain-containing protein n=1 Tax=Stephanodiscus triporus TaxID=2934178 RepID=A0ABD3N6J4_9STRA
MRRGRILSLFATALPPILIQLLSLGIYLHPLTSAPTPSSEPSHRSRTRTKRYILITDPRPQLDEIHLTSTDNLDVNPPRYDYEHDNDNDDGRRSRRPSWTDAWRNDYWGRPLPSANSHKSWRPASVWSFRFGRGGTIGRRTIMRLARMCGYLLVDDDGDDPSSRHRLASELFVHRLVNVCIHAAIVRLVGIVSTLLFFRRPHDDYDDYDDDDDDGPRLHLPSHTTTAYASQLLFAVHPSHVEVVANAANRPHLLALLSSITIADPATPFPAVFALVVLGLLSCETAIFQYPAVIATMTAIRYRELSMSSYTKTTRTAEEEMRRRRRGKRRNGASDAVASRSSFEGEMTTTMTTTHPEKDSAVLIRTAIELLPRYILLLLASALYLFYRIKNDSLSIPDGLIRPAENPFYDNVSKRRWTAIVRIVNYSYVIGLHVMKAFGVEVVGYSHEYGYDCIPEIRVGRPFDVRMALPASIVVVLLLATASALSWRVGGGRAGRTGRVLPCLAFLSWMATLFPIAGILKVGTFVSDRIVVPSTFGTCILAGRAFAVCLAGGRDGDVNDETMEEEDPSDDDDSEDKVGGHFGTNRVSSRRRRSATATSTTTTTKKITCLAIFFLYVLCVCNLAGRTHRRASEWMDSMTLLESSLRACPRSIKSNLEMSKIYSGLVPHMLDLERALSLISTAQTIDPTYCDVHYQYAHVYIQQGKYIPFEEELVESLQCQFTMGQAMNMWQKYWKVVLSDNSVGDDKRKKEAGARYQKYMTRIRAVIAEDEKKNRLGSVSSSSHSEVKDEL